jgi:hypothetical protein
MSTKSDDFATTVSAEFGGACTSIISAVRDPTAGTACMLLAGARPAFEPPASGETLPMIQPDVRRISQRSIG